MNGLGVTLIFMGLMFFIRWVIVTSVWKQKADKYDEAQKQHDDIDVKNLEEMLEDEERTRTARNIKLAYGFVKELLTMIISFLAKLHLQKSNSRGE